MFVLGIETATLVAGVALVTDDKVISEHFVNNRKTHSQNLMPMVREVLEEGGLRPKDLDAVAISVGPGSFTGLRIGMATAKTLAQALNIPIVGVPTLDALTHNLYGLSGIISPILDAKKNQVYASLFRGQDLSVEKLTDYMAVSLEELVLRLQGELKIGEKVTFLGDAVPVFKESIMDSLGSTACFASDVNLLPRGASVAKLGLDFLKAGKRDNLFSLKPLYIRQSEAELNWEKKKANDQ